VQIHRRPVEIDDVGSAVGTSGLTLEEFEASPAKRTRSSTKKAGVTPELKSSSGSNESRKVESGVDLLDNNQVNFLMAATMSVSAIFVYALFFGLSFRDVIN
jgi:hypothetical protein